MVFFSRVVFELLLIYSLWSFNQHYIQEDLSIDGEDKNQELSNEKCFIFAVALFSQSNPDC
ncbi:hypothetical protein C7B61_07685 [filamentous cyanobacterium CCP1]|nr:hypothetical protein C7B76_09120 [filamentous cyanobacterium CCP2]PSB67150.1 hypothetical protein C7B61_07685 [filamentous cyanobacterium CCP1]